MKVTPKDPGDSPLELLRQVGTAQAAQARQAAQAAQELQAEQERRAAEQRKAEQERFLVCLRMPCDTLPSGKRLRSYGQIHHFQWVNPL